MRFPLDLLPPVGVVDDRYEIPQAEAVRPAPAVGPRTQPPLVVRPRPKPKAEAEAPRQPPEREQRAQGDRRQGERRVAQLPVTVDTRSGIDRRQNKRRSDDPTPRIDEKV